MAGDHVLAIDLGTSGPKVAVVTLTGKVVAWQNRTTRLVLAEGGAAEQDPEDWWRAIVEATHAVIEQAGLTRDRVAAVAVTCHWAGVVAVNAQGTPLHPAIIWMDSRGARYMPELAGGLVRIEGYGVRKLARWIRLTGGAPSLAGKEPVAHMALLRHEYPEVHRAAAMFLEPKDWLNHRLTGEFVATIDSIAVWWSTDNRDLAKVDYDPVLLERAGLDRAKLPRLVQATDVIGTLTSRAAEQLGLDPSTVVVGGTPDVQSGSVGSGAVRDGEPHLYVGTSSWLSCHVPYKKTDLFHNIASLPSALPGRYFVGNSQETAGACLEWLRDSVLFPADALGGTRPDDFWARLEALARSAPAGSGGTLFTPWLYGERCPIADHRIRAGFHRMTLRTTRAELVRSVYEGVAYNMRWLLLHVEKFVGHRLDSIRFIGGGAGSPLWNQIMADVLDREIQQVADPRVCNARGAALLASLALGAIEVDDIPAMVPIARSFAPDPEHRELHARRFAEFLRLYRRNRAIHARLDAA
ncbi:xylulokinase [Nannocystaceae bacterium ST9]